MHYCTKQDALSTVHKKTYIRSPGQHWSELRFGPWWRVQVDRSSLSSFSVTAFRNAPSLENGRRFFALSLFSLLSTYDYGVRRSAPALSLPHWAIF
jgi:hypothetical protein